MVEPPKQTLEKLACPGDLVMRFLEDEGRDGEPPRSISFVGIDFKPLGYDELAGARLHLPPTVPLDWVGACRSASAGQHHLVVARSDS